MRACLVVLVTLLAVAPARAETPSPSTKKPAVAMRYRTLEKMLRRFSRQAGEPRPRG